MMECLVLARSRMISHPPSSLCTSCLARSRRQLRCRFSVSHVRPKHIAQPGEQANSIAGYYESLLGSQSAVLQPAASTRHTDLEKSTSASEQARKTREEVEAKAKLVFGDPYAGPLAQKLAKERKSTNVAGVMVPPRPTEPDNCCMSGCVNCVWDLYREDLEEWAAKASEAQSRLQAQGKTHSADAQRLETFTGGTTKDTGLPGGAPSMDDDGGGSESLWTPDMDNASPPKPGEDLFASIPVGIKQFMATEKAIKQKHNPQLRPP